MVFGFYRKGKIINIEMQNKVLLENERCSEENQTGLLRWASLEMSVREGLAEAVTFEQLRNRESISGRGNNG